jgi:hypothetical protein
VENLKSIDKVRAIRAELKTLQVDNEAIINPSLWQLK